MRRSPADIVVETQGPLIGLEGDSFQRLGALLHETEGVQNAWLFGSRGKGIARPGSDIDLAIDAPTFTRMDVHRLAGRIDELHLPVFTDVLALHLTDHKAVLDRIKEEGRLIYKA